MPRKPVASLDVWLQSLQSALNAVQQTAGTLRQVEAAIRSAQQLGLLLEDMFVGPSTSPETSLQRPEIPRMEMNGRWPSSHTSFRGGRGRRKGD